MSDMPRDAAVFGGLDAFDDSATDPDAVDRMLLNLAAATDPPDWQMDALGSDFYSPSLSYPSLPLHYMDAPPPPRELSEDVTDRHSSTPPTPASKRPTQPPSSTPLRSPVTSGSSTKPRAPTAACSLCGKRISTNGANFRRHEQACRRTNAYKISASRPSSAMTIDPPLVGSSSAPEQSSPPQSISIPMTRRDSDLLNVVRRLEQSINTLDVSARLCLRDALVSLSNKAANPTVPPTPQQEAMNRAAEYLVLRMLFLSGQQVMHTAPGTPGPFQETLPPSTTPSQGSVLVMPPDPGDGTVAASTTASGSGVSVAISNSLDPNMEESCEKPEDKGVE